MDAHYYRLWRATWPSGKGGGHLEHSYNDPKVRCLSPFDQSLATDLQLVSISATATGNRALSSHCCDGGATVQ